MFSRAQIEALILKAAEYAPFVAKVLPGWAGSVILLVAAVAGNQELLDKLLDLLHIAQANQTAAFAQQQAELSA